MIYKFAQAFLDGQSRRENSHKEPPKVNRVLKILHLKEFLFHAEKEQEILDEVCRIIVEDGAYRMAWIGYPEKNKTIRPVASCGYEAGYLESAMITWDDAERGRYGLGDLFVEARLGDLLHLAQNHR